MDLRLDEQQTMLRDSAARFLRDEHGFERRQALIRQAEPEDPGLYSQLAELGWPGAWLSEEDGGLGGSVIELSILAEEMGRALYLGPFLPAALCAAALRGGALRGAMNDAATSLLAGITDGSSRAAFAHMEPGARGLLDRPRTLATRTATGLNVSGVKRLVHQAQFADQLVVSALLDGQVVLVRVAAGSAGLDITPQRTIDNDWAADVEMHDVAAELLVDGDAAGAALGQVTYVAMVALGAEALGLCEAAFEQTHEFLKTRRQFGRNLIEFQALQHRLSDMFVEIEQLRASLLNALAAEHGDGAEQSQAAYGLKIQLGTVASSVAGQCLHLHGGMGMTDEMPVSHYYRRARVMQAQFGNNDYYLNEYARNLHYAF